MDVRGTAPVYIPPAYPFLPPPQPTKTPAPPLSAFVKSSATGVSPSQTAVRTQERRIGQKIKIAFVLTLFFIVLQLHPVLAFLDRGYSMFTMSPFELANEYGCATLKGTVFVSIVFFIIALLWMRSL